MPDRYKSGVLIDLGTPSTHLGDEAERDWPRQAAKEASGWLGSLLATVSDAVWGGTGLAAVALGPYVLETPEHVYGEGGYGRVLRARDSASGETVAVKEVAGGSERRHSAVVKEVAILRRLSGARGAQHPHVVAFKGYFERGPKHYIVMEAVTGGELFDCVAGGELVTEAAGRALFAQLVAGVQHVHACGVAHRDLKLENVLVAADGTLKLADFGLAHLHRARASGFEPELLREFCGSKSYCPPEMLAQQPYDAFLADVWSLGVCLFALLAGFFPFEEAGARDWRFGHAAKAQLQGGSNARVIFGFYRRPCPFSAELVALLDGMLRVEPAARLAMAGVAASPWLVPPDERPPAAPPAAPAAPPDPSVELDLGSLDVAHRSGGPASGASADAPAAAAAAVAALPPRLARQRALSRVGVA